MCDAYLPGSHADEREIVVSSVVGRNELRRYCKKLCLMGPQSVKDNSEPPPDNELKSSDRLDVSGLASCSLL